VSQNSQEFLRGDHRKALSAPTRRRVLEPLRKRPMSTGELADCFIVSKPTMSTHFAVLREAGLVISERLGKSVVYELQMHAKT
jgi:DNA-binding transcriptional ArsR family regulator